MTERLWATCWPRCEGGGGAIRCPPLPFPARLASTAVHLHVTALSDSCTHTLLHACVQGGGGDDPRRGARPHHLAGGVPHPPQAGPCHQAHDGSTCVSRALGVAGWECWPRWGAAMPQPLSGCLRGLACMTPARPAAACPPGVHPDPPLPSRRCRPPPPRLSHSSPPPLSPPCLLPPLPTDRGMSEVFGARYCSLHVRVTNRAAFHLYTETLGYK